MNDPRPSPLRYPGGKAYMYNFIKNIISDVDISSHLEYIEPYAGGGGLALRLLRNKDVRHIHLNDLDKGIWSFWYAVLNYYNEFLDKLYNTNISIEEWTKQRDVYFSLRRGELSENDILDLGFATFFLNRTNRSGIIHSGGVIGGKSQVGKYKIDARFNLLALEQKLYAIYSLRNRISIYNEDGSDFIGAFQCLNNSFLFIDPPYYSKSKKLYYSNFTDTDHIKLRDTLSKIGSLWILTYDYHPYIYQLYNNFHIYKFTVPYSANRARTGSEFLISNHKLSFLSPFELVQ